tara:strand:+ start:39 stop:767 length:729 start_codon:yes stop_codon:yes gene_type:complete
MIKKILSIAINFIISLIDYSNKKKIVLFFNKAFNEKKLSVIDIGAHKGETIDLFLKNFSINQLNAFEPNQNLYHHLNKKYNNKKVNIFNLGIGLKNEISQLNVMFDSSSSTINDLDQNTDYFKRKAKIFSSSIKGDQFLKEKQNIKLISLSHFIENQDIDNIDILKIDTEGYEFNIVRGINSKDFEKIRFIYFEHHYDLMIKKGYKFKDIDSFLKKNNFTQVLKIRMKFRKSFEYIYEAKKK